jgi:hypothetical protein
MRGAAVRGLLVVILLSSCAEPPFRDASGEPSLGAQQCERLAVLYDRYGFWIGTQAPPGWNARVNGAIDCSRGKHASGVKLLSDALRSVGFRPEQISAAAAGATIER